MRRIVTHVLVLFLVSSLSAQQMPSRVSIVFGSEPQNKLASQLPALLLEAYRLGDISAYYPMRPDIRIPYGQFLQHFGEPGKAQAVLANPPSWFCGDRSFPKPGLEQVECLSMRFELIEQLERNKISQLNEWKQQYIRLIYDDSCDPRGISTAGPIFKISEMAKLTQPKYQLANPKNQAVKYTAYDILKLRIFAARMEKNR